MPRDSCHGLATRAATGRAAAATGNSACSARSWRINSQETHVWFMYSSTSVFSGCCSNKMHTISFGLEMYPVSVMRGPHTLLLCKYAAWECAIVEGFDLRCSCAAHDNDRTSQGFSWGRSKEPVKLVVLQADHCPADHTTGANRSSVWIHGVHCRSNSLDLSCLPVSFQRRSHTSYVVRYCSPSLQLAN
jgi:hypothetical protein